MSWVPRARPHANLFVCVIWLNPCNVVRDEWGFWHLIVSTPKAAERKSCSVVSDSS